MAARRDEKGFSMHARADMCRMRLASDAAANVAMRAVTQDGSATPESEKGRDAFASQPLNLLVPEIGVEPTTFALRMRCSTN